MEVPFGADVVIGEVSMEDEFGALLTDESSLAPPELRTNYLTVPGRDGDLDLTDALTGDATFGFRVHDLVFYLPDGDFERVKTRVSNYLHGRRYKYRFAFDPGYVYEGRFSVTDYAGWRDRRIQVRVDADPWKLAEHRDIPVQAAGGTFVECPNGRRQVSPTFKTNGAVVIEFGSDAWEIPEAGEWKLPDLRLPEGGGTIYLNSAPTLCDTTWLDLEETYGTWDALKGKRWTDVLFTKGDPPKGAEYEVVISYDVYDL